jgi:deoxyribose-phosphate aldolase
MSSGLDPLDLVDRLESAVQAKAVEEKVAELPPWQPTRRSLLTMISCSDVTALTPGESRERMADFAARALHPGGDPDLPKPAAVCVLSEHVGTVTGVLSDSDVKVAAVVGGFPSGRVAPDVKAREIEAALAAGAEEIDLVVDWKRFLDEGPEPVVEEVQICRRAAAGATLKVILEAGMIDPYDRLRQLTTVVLGAGADLVKTSTGKVGLGATPGAAFVMAGAIHDFHVSTGRDVGLKVAGGIRTPADAGVYTVIAERTLGRAALTPERFRIGASRLLGALVTELHRLEQPEQS